MCALEDMDLSTHKPTKHVQNVTQTAPTCVMCMEQDFVMQPAILAIPLAKPSPAPNVIRSVTVPAWPERDYVMVPAWLAGPWHQTRLVENVTQTAVKLDARQLGQGIASRVVVTRVLVQLQTCFVLHVILTA